MSSNIIPFPSGQLSSIFAGQNYQDELSTGIAGGFGHIGYKGKVWAIRYRGREFPLMRDDGDGPRNSIEVVILKSSTVISKIFYAQQFADGSTERPDCYSLNGVAPELDSRARQNDICATCRHNMWGSQITPSGKQGKACKDAKRIAVVPLGDIKNEAFGGALLLRIPPTSLAAAAQYGQTMQKMGYPLVGIGTRISFDPGEAYPKFMFQAVRPLTDLEAQFALEMRNDPQVDRILAESEHTAVPGSQYPGAVFEQPPAQGSVPYPHTPHHPTPSPSTTSSYPTTAPSATASPQGAAPTQSQGSQPFSTPTHSPAPSAPMPSQGGQPSQPSPTQSPATTMTGFGPMPAGIGVASSPPAPAAGTNGVTPATSPSAPASTQPAASKARTKKAGGAGTASTSTSATTETSPSMPTSPQPMPQEAEGEPADEFTQALDSRLKNLLPG